MKLGRMFLLPKPGHPKEINRAKSQLPKLRDGVDRKREGPLFVDFFDRANPYCILFKQSCGFMVRFSSVRIQLKRENQSTSVV